MLRLFWITVCSSKISKNLYRELLLSTSRYDFPKSTPSDGINIHIDFIQFSEKKIIFNLN